MRTEDELIREVRILAGEHRTRTSMTQHFYSVNSPEGVKAILRHDPEAFGVRPDLMPPATTEAVRAAEALVGFRFPPLLIRLWTEVANGGFGPGYGLLGVEGGFPFDDHGGLTIAENYRSCTTGWPRRLCLCTSPATRVETRLHPRWHTRRPIRHPPPGTPGPPRTTRWAERHEPG